MFKRKYNLALAPLVWAKYRSQINAENIESLTSFKINRIFKDEDDQARQWYMHYVLSNWFKLEKETLNRSTMDRLKKIIKKSKMVLNEIEEHEMLMIEERIFSTERTLKKLDTYQKLLPGEFIWARFNSGNLYILDKANITFKVSKTKQFWTQEDVLKHEYSGPLLISNKRFIIESHKEVKKVRFQDIKIYSHVDYGFEFTINNQQYLLRAHDQKTLNNTIDLIFRKKAKHVIKKRKNN